ncbi:acyl-CoA dehydrogenase family protein [Lentzea sp. NBRC 102530]|uniref:acyl-CoA dehydrogenase family protein n=1 Tax=Lentzea sp. NBRC 102530 TaxID=3032201 RepID=UPI0024A1AAFC|nr:acyl-CoA dehydrogenase family protein [Lentzea sp. NBRC 102530]GLY48784.1 monooxygenase [Lentzea sp. NBRC 102530]
MTNWLDVAHEVAATLRSDAADRDRANQPPTKEVELLRQSGLLNVREWSVQQQVSRIIGAADANVGHLLGYHYLQIWRSGLFDSAFSDQPDQFWAGVSNPLDAALELTPTGTGFTLNGRKTFATGAAVADRLVVSATRTDNGEKLTFLLDGKAAGITYLDDWDNIGQRLTASGGVTFENVEVTEVLGVQPANEDPRLSLAALGFQLVLAQLYVALAEGALAEAADYTRTKTRPWFVSGVEAATEDPYIVVAYGEMVAQTRAAGLLADEAARRLWEASELGRHLTPAKRAEVAIVISEAKVVSTKLVNEVTSRIFEQVGARGTAAKYAVDRFWRNARTLTLHDPVVYKAREVGEHFLTGARPAHTGYS